MNTDGAPELTIRTMEPDDLEQVIAIENASYSTPWTVPTFRGLVARGDADLVVAELAGEVVGYAVAWAVIDQAELGNVAVAPMWRRRGIAGRLLEAILARLRTRGVREIFLEVRESNHEAQHLYRRFGFEPVGRRDRYYSAPVEDALVMSRRLEASGARVDSLFDEES